MGRIARDLTGQRFGNLVAEYRIAADKAGYVRWACTCDCGATHNVRSSYLVNGTVTRCRRCQRLNIVPDAAYGVTVVDTWVHGAGLDGGFAVARDAQGVVKALTTWSRVAQNLNREPESITLVRRAMRRLVEAGHVRAAADKEGPKRWMRRVNVRANAPRFMTPWPEMLAQWLAAGGSIEEAHPDARPPSPPRTVPVVLGATSTP